MTESCECKAWASLHPEFLVLTGHHENCPKRPPAHPAWRDLVQQLCKGVEHWAADEDGVHPDAWDAYRKAKSVLGQFDWKEPCQQCGCEHPINQFCP